MSSSLPLKRRRQQLAHQFDGPVLLWSGQRPPRNFPANALPFRASSHFLYFAGRPIANAVLHLENGDLTLFLDDPPPSDALWHGPSPSRADWATQIDADAHYPLSELHRWTTAAATLPVQDWPTRHQQTQLLGRDFMADHPLTGRDRTLALAIATLRLHHDPVALTEIRTAISCTVTAHRAGMAATPTAPTEADVRATMEAVIMAQNMTCAYGSIVTVHGEVLHNEQYDHPLPPGGLLLADVGAETPNGWAADITRTWPISGQFSSTQRDLYDIVLAAHDAAIAQIAPGVEYRDIHLQAALTLTEGLVQLGILTGPPADLVAQDAHALFFPHGVGHLLGLDVHDMEDLGDLAGYAAGRSRSSRFGLGFLRLDRPLAAGMVVTIEPGFYQVPAILNDPKMRQRYAPSVNWERLDTFADVRGIRIEDDVCVTATGSEVLSAALPTQPDAICALVGEHAPHQTLSQVP